VGLVVLGLAVTFVFYGLQLIQSLQQHPDITVGWSGDTSETEPDTSFDYSYSGASETVEVHVEGGETFTAQRVQFEGQGVVDSGAQWHETDPTVGPTSRVGAGDSAVVEVTGPDYALEIVWESADGEERSVIGTSTGPGRQTTR
jgi:hypothetical protein